MSRLVRNRVAAAGMTVVLLYLLVAVLASSLAPHPYTQMQLLSIYQGPTPTHWLGTDALGRDQLSRLLYGARISMSVGLITVAVVLVVGVSVGLASGYYGGRVDAVLMRIVDVGYAFPGLLLVIVISAYLSATLPNIRSGPLLILKDGYNATGGVVGVITALALFGWLSVARLVRGQVLGLKQRDFVEAARALGAPGGRIMLLHLLPNALATVIVAAAIYMPEFIIAEAGLSFIGLGVRPPTPSWGIMLSEGVSAIRSHPYVALEPGIAIAILLLAFNFFADGLRDAMDPLMRDSRGTR